MKAKISSLLFLSLLSISPLALSETTQNVDHSSIQADVKKDGEVIAWISAIDNFEIKVSQIALDKNVSGSVKDYATMLNSDHSKNLQQVTALSNELGDKPLDTQDLTQFKKDGTNQLSELKTQGNNFQAMFIDAMVTGHTDALKKVNNDLMKKVSSQKLKTLLQDTGTMIAHHLELAKEIKKNMMTKPKITS